MFEAGPEPDEADIAARPDKSEAGRQPCAVDLVDEIVGMVGVPGAVDAVGGCAAVDERAQLVLAGAEEVELAARWGDDLMPLALELADDGAADEAAAASDEDPAHQIVSSGIAVTNFAPQLRAWASWPSISSRKFHGKMTMKSGLSESIRSGATTGMWLPGR